MKKIFSGGLFVIAIIYAVAASAEPERIMLKNPAKKTKENAALSQIKNIYLGDIEDPAARAAIQQLYQYLGIDVKK